MKKHLWRTVLCVGLAVALPLAALASNFYLFADSGKRRLSYEEVAAWQYDALGYAFNELFARHGRPFEPGGKYDNYFSSQTWYQPNAAYPGDGKALNDTEWYNYKLFKQVRADMKAAGTTNPSGKPLPAVFDDRIASPLGGFFEIHLKGNQKLKVYDGPGEHYRRGAQGKAVASTNGRLYAAGWESSWLMVMYEVNNGGVRVGFASPKDFRDKVDAPQLLFDAAPAVTLAQAQLTEDPVKVLTPIATLAAGTPVTWLSRFYGSQRSWDYVEVQLNGQLMRGFLPQGIVETGYQLTEESSGK